MRWNAFVRGAWRQLPVETAVVAAAAAGAIGLNHDDEYVWYGRLLLAGLVATPLAFAAHRLARFGRRVPVIAGALAAAGVFAVVSLALRRDDDLSSPAFHWPYLLSLIAATLLPFVTTGPAFSRFVRRFFEQTTTWGVLCGAAVLAVHVVAVALEELFDLPLRRLDGDAMIVVGSAIVLVYLYRLRADDPAGRGQSSDQAREKIPELWRRLATMVGAPFVSAMLVILAAYEVVARLRGELPRNMLSPLILAAGLVGFVSTLIVSAVLDEKPGTGVLAPADPHRWTRRWSVRLTRAFPAVLLALLPMAWWALWLRIDQYGLTPFRAVRATGLVCLTSLSILGTLRWWRGRTALSWEVPAAIAGFALVAAFGPLSAVQLSIRSQASRVASLLDAAGVQRTVPDVAFPTAMDEVLAATPAQRIELARDHYSEINRALDALLELGGERAVRRVLRGPLGHCARRWDSELCLAQLGVVPRSDPPSRADLFPASMTPVAAPVITPALTTEARGRIAAPAGELESIALDRTPDEPRAPWTSPAFSGFRLGAADLAYYADGIEIARARLGDLLAPHDALPDRTHELIGADGRVAADLAIQRIQRWLPTGRGPQLVELRAIVIWRRESASSAAH